MKNCVQKITVIAVCYFGILSLLTYLKAKCKKKKIMDNATSNRHFKVNFILKYMTVLISLKKCDALRDLVPFVPFKKHKKTPMEEWYFYLSCRLKACIFTKSNTPPWVFFTFLELFKRYQIAQNIIYSNFMNVLGLIS